MQLQNKFDSFTTAFSATKPQEVITGFQNVTNGKKIIIYGAALIGEVLLKCLNELGISVAHIIDRDAERISKVLDVEVELPKRLKDIADNSQDYLIIFATSERTAKEVDKDLKSLGLSFDVISNGQHIVDCLRAAICANNHMQDKDISHAFCGDCSILDSICPVLRQRARDEVGSNLNKAGSQKTVTIGYALGNICSLNCKFCFESVSMYEKEQRHFVETETVIKDIKRVAEASEFITFVEFIGGEPFLHKGLPEIIKFCLNTPNIAYVHVFTNGTVIPSPDLINALSHERASVYISNYTGFLTQAQEKNVHETKRALENSGIQHMYGGEKKWFDMSNYGYHEEPQDELEKRYANCQTHNCNRLHNGILYVCPHHFAGVNLGKFSEADTLHINDFSDAELVKELDNFKEITFAQACKYCDMPNAPLIRSGD